ncbi:cilia- and flagella-associated protein 206-like isoform X2 [Argonauta hians]
MASGPIENTIKDIIKEISMECAKKGEQVSDTLVAFMVKIVVLNPKYGFNINRNLTKDDVRALIQRCIVNFLDVNSPVLDTIKMQVYYDMNYTTRDQFLAEHRRLIETRIQPVLREITDNRAKVREEFDNLYQSIISLILLRSGLGNPSDYAVIREATAAVQSIFPQSELVTFLKLSKQGKERQILELTLISTGIRLFNKEYCKGGKGIDDLPSLLRKIIPKSIKSITKEINSVASYIDKYTSILCTALKEGETSDKRTPKQLHTMKQALICVRQLEKYLLVLQKDLLSSERNVGLYLREMKNFFEKINGIIENKTAVPTDHVYPQFIRVSKLWNYLQEEVGMLGLISKISLNLNTQCKAHAQIFTEKVLTPMLEGVEVIGDAQRMGLFSEKVDLNKVSPNPEIEWLIPETNMRFDELILEFGGFCPVTLCETDRLLLPGNCNLGIAKYHTYYYAFASTENAYEFARDPERYLNTIIEIAKSNPELIQLLQLYNQFLTIIPEGKERKNFAYKSIVKSENATQTDTHFLDKNIVKGYEWNEWELRRKAIKLTDLRNKVTHSAQTHASNYRRLVSTQTYLPKEVITQTRQDGSSNVPRPQVFLAGLRGSGTSKPTVLTKVDLTLDVESK